MLKTKVSSLAKIKYSITAGIVVVCCLITYRFTQPVDASKESELFTGATTTKDAVYNTVTVSKGTLSSAYQGQASIEYSNYKTIEVSEEFISDDRRVGKECRLGWWVSGCAWV